MHIKRLCYGKKHLLLFLLLLCGSHILYSSHLLPVSPEFITSRPNKWSRILLDKPVVAQLLKKFPAVYGTQEVNCRVQISSKLGHMNPVQVLIFYLLKIHFNIILPCTDRSRSSLFHSNFRKIYFSLSPLWDPQRFQWLQKATSLGIRRLKRECGKVNNILARTVPSLLAYS